MLLPGFLLLQTTLASSKLFLDIHSCPQYRLFLFPTATGGFPLSSFYEQNRRYILKESADPLLIKSILRNQLEYSNSALLSTPALTSFSPPINGHQRGPTSVGSSSSWAGGYSWPGTDGISPTIPIPASAQASATAGGVTYSSSSSSGTPTQTGNVAASSESHSSLGSNEHQNTATLYSSSSGSMASSATVGGVGTYPLHPYYHGSTSVAGTSYPQTSVTSLANTAAGSNTYSSGYYQKPQNIGGYSTTSYQYNKPYTITNSATSATYPNFPGWPSVGASGSGAVAGSSSSVYNQNKPAWPSAGSYTNTGASSGSSSATSSAIYPNKPVWPSMGSGIVTSSGSTGHYSGYYNPQGTGTYTSSYYNRPVTSTASGSYSGSSANAQGQYYNGYYKPTSVTSGASSGGVTQAGGQYNGYYNPFATNTGTYSGYYWPTTSGSRPNNFYWGSNVTPHVTPGGATTVSSTSFSNYSNRPWWLGTGVFGTGGNSASTSNGSQWWFPGTYTSIGSGSSSFNSFGSGSGPLTGQTNANIVGPTAGYTSGTGTWTGNSYGGASGSSGTNPVYIPSTTSSIGSSSTSISGAGSTSGVVGSAIGASAGGGTSTDTVVGLGSLGSILSSTGIVGSSGNMNIGSAGLVSETGKPSGTSIISTMASNTNEAGSISSNGYGLGSGSGLTSTNNVRPTVGATTGSGTSINTYSGATGSSGTKPVNVPYTASSIGSSYVSTSTSLENMGGLISPATGSSTTSSTTIGGGLGTFGSIFSSIGSGESSRPSGAGTISAAGSLSGGQSISEITSVGSASGSISVGGASSVYTGGNTGANGSSLETFTGTGVSLGSISEASSGMLVSTGAGAEGTAVIGGSTGNTEPISGTSTVSMIGLSTGPTDLIFSSGSVSETHNESRPVQPSAVISPTSVGTENLGGSSMVTGSSLSVMEGSLLTGSFGSESQAVNNISSQSASTSAGLQSSLSMASGGSDNTETVSLTNNNILSGSGSTTTSMVTANSQATSPSGPMAELSVLSSTVESSTVPSSEETLSAGNNIQTQTSHFITMSSTSGGTVDSSVPASSISVVHPGPDSSISLSVVENGSTTLAESGASVSSTFANKPLTVNPLINKEMSTGLSSVFEAATSGNIGTSTVNAVVSSSSASNHGESYSVATGPGINQNLAGSGVSTLGSVLGTSSENAANAGGLLSGILSIAGSVPGTQGSFSMSQSEVGSSYSSTQGSHAGADSLTGSISGSEPEVPSQSLPSSSGALITSAGQQLLAGLNGSHSNFQNILGGFSANISNVGDLLTGIVNAAGSGTGPSFQVPENQGILMISPSEVGTQGSQTEVGGQTDVSTLGSGAETSSISSSSSSSGSSIESAGQQLAGLNGSPPLLQNIIGSISGNAANVGGLLSGIIHSAGAAIGGGNSFHVPGHSGSEVGSNTVVEGSHSGTGSSGSITAGHLVNGADASSQSMYSSSSGSSIASAGQQFTSFNAQNALNNILGGGTQGFIFPS